MGRGIAVVDDQNRASPLGQEPPRHFAGGWPQVVGVVRIDGLTRIKRRGRSDAGLEQRLDKSRLSEPRQADQPHCLPGAREDAPQQIHAVDDGHGLPLGGPLIDQGEFVIGDIARIARHPGINPGPDRPPAA